MVGQHQCSGQDELAFPLRLCICMQGFGNPLPKPTGNVVPRFSWTLAKAQHDENQLRALFEKLRIPMTAFPEFAKAVQEADLVKTTSAQQWQQQALRRPTCRLFVLRPW